MQKTIISTSALVAIAMAGASAACSNSTIPEPRAVLVYGPSVSFAQGSARAWVQTDSLGAPSAIGIAMTEGALNGLPSTVTGPSPTALMATLPLPAEAAGTGIDHAEVGWNPNGHEPQQLYGVPHFDIHFYMVSTATQMAIVPSDPQFAAKAANVPASAFVPAGYVPPPAPIAASAVPQMGVHWVDVKSPELNGKPFTNTFIFGSWDGKFIFHEAMISKAYLESHPNTTLPIPQPAQWQSVGAFPTTYGVSYEATAKEFRFTLGGLTKHGA
ncbi:MAG: DUF5602 domain-containing protein [bacterium]